MPYFPDEWINELLSKTDIASLASEYVSLSPKGGRLWGCCPFHTEKTPSFSVIPDKQFYYCFGCHKGGGVINFMMEIENLPYVDAVKRLAERAGMELPSEINDEKLRSERAHKERLYSACKDAAKFFFTSLKSAEGERARKYLERRAVSPSVAASFGIGYAPDSWDALTDHLKKAGYSDAELIDAGLAIRNKSNTGVYSAFRGRLIFPIISPARRVLGFGARTLEKGVEPKYINTGDTPIYNKRNNLYALNTQRGKHGGELIMVEGYMDVVSLHAAGVTSAIASLGTAMTAQQARLVKRYSDNVFLCYDGDPPGINASLRALDVLSREGVGARVIVIPGNMDPDDYVKKYGRTGFLKLRDSALTANGFRLECMAKDCDLGNENGRESFARKACAFIGGLDPVERERYAPVVARKTGLPLDSIKAQCALTPGVTAGNSIGKSRNTRTMIRQESQESATLPDKAELMLAAMMLSSAENAAAVSDKMAAEGVVFSAEGLARLSDMALVAWATGLTPDVPAMLAEMNAADAATAAASLAYDVAAADVEKASSDCVRQLRLRSLEAEMEALTRSLERTPADERTETMEKLRKMSAELRKYKS